MNWPETLPMRRVYNYPVTSLEIALTFVELAKGGTDNNGVFDSVNLIPFIDTENVSVPHEDLKWRFTISTAIRNED